MVSVLMKKLAIAAVAGAVMVSASGCSLVSSGKRIIRVSHAQSETHPEHLGMLAFKEYVEEHLGDKYEVQIFPNPIVWENYANVWKQSKIQTYFGNSLMISVISVLGIMFLSICNGYALRFSACLTFLTPRKCTGL